MSIEFDTSVVIGFRNWGADRIRLATESIQASFGDFRGEVIISDYGSDEPEPARAVAELLDARYVYTAGDPVWSRSRALNAGFAIARGRVLISTDADMLFSPTSMSTITAIALESPEAGLFLQCRDLPESLDSHAIAQTGVDWALFERSSRLRPRWGMGGMMAVTRAGFDAVRGFDERLHTYGGEDLDFAQRLRRAGYKTVWINDPSVRMYHMWHPSSRKAAEQTAEGKRAVDFNRDIVYNDKSFVRNAATWKHAPADRAPLVTVSISTHNRSHLLKQAIQSALAQTVQDFEIVIVDDGSTDDTAAVVAEFGDDRIRYFYQEQAGIAAARNRAADESRGEYTAVLDDDDLMPAERLEWQLAAMDGGAAGSVGGFLNFDDETGETNFVLSEIPSPATAAPRGGAPGHGTWLVRTELIRQFRYDERLTSGVDNNLMLRMLRCGLRFNHTGKAVLLRRTHDLQVTVTDGDNQGAAAERALAFHNFSMTEWSRKRLDELRKDASFPAGVDRDAIVAEAMPYLPDHLIVRDVRVHGVSSAELHDLALDGTVHGVEVHRDGVFSSGLLSVEGATYEDLVRMRHAGYDWDVVSASAKSASATLKTQLQVEHWLAPEIDAFFNDGCFEGINLALVTEGEGEGESFDRAVGSRALQILSQGDTPREYTLWGYESSVDASRALLDASGPAFLLGPFALGDAE